MTKIQRLINRLRLLFPLGKKSCLANFDSFVHKPKRILCMPAAGIGDVIMDAPAIHAIKQKFPDAKISVLVHYNRSTDQVCQLIKGVDETIDFPLVGYRWSDVICFMLISFWFLAFNLRKRNFDLAVVFWPNPIRRLLLALGGSKYWLYGNLTDQYPPLQNEKLLEPFGIEIVQTENIFQIPTPSQAEKVLPPNLPRPLIGVNPFCGMAWRQWDKFDLLQKELLNLNATVVTIGKDKNYKPVAGTVCLVNKLSLAELFWVISKLDIFVTADSGPMHIAFALGIPTVALFGPVPPVMRVSPQNNQNIKIIYKASHESEKVIRATQRKRFDNSAMQSITTEEVMEIVRSQLNAC